MKVYNYDPETRVYIDVSDAFPDPLDIGKWLIPAHASTTPPPIEVPKGMSSRWNGVKWELVSITEDTKDTPPQEPPVQEQPELPQKEFELSTEFKILICKQTAQDILFATDYTQLEDVKPLLGNVAAFATYRTQIRLIYFNPVENPVWPVEPKPNWVTK
jgi:hypothetical protein